MANIVDSLRIGFKEQSDLGPQCVLIPDSLKNEADYGTCYFFKKKMERKKKFAF